MNLDNTARIKLLYLMSHLDSFIENEVYNVLSDSVEDPQHSAVTTCNLVKCYIDVMKSLGQEAVPEDIKQYLLDKCFTDDEITCFLDKKSKESKYYVGRQF